MNTLVSIIMPTRDRLTFLSRAINSVLRQTVPDWELLVLDDSEDKLAVAKLCQIDLRVRYVNRGGVNIAQARSLGIRLAKGEYVALLDSDDYWESDKLERHLEVWKGQRLSLSWDRWADVFDETVAPSRQPFAHGIVNPRMMASRLYWNNFVHSSSGLTLTRLARQASFDWNLFSDWALYALVAQYYDSFFIDRILTFRDVSAEGRVSDTETRRKLLEAGRTLKNYLVITRPWLYGAPWAKETLATVKNRIIRKPVTI